MFCPVCNTEYRPGFTRCSDCEVELVEEPPHYALAGKNSAEPGDPNEDPFCSFWKGEDSRVHAELCQLLEESGIPHKSVFRRDHLFHFSNFSAYEVGVPFSQFEHAEKVVQEAYGPAENEEVSEPQEPSAVHKGLVRMVPFLPERVTLPQEEIPGPPTAGEGGNWFPEDATANVWAGGSDELGGFLVAALHENSIHCRLEQQGSHARLYVLPHDASRAHEIIREVVEATPPE